MTKINEDLFVGKVDEGELVTVIGLAFNECRQASADEYHYYESGDLALVLRYEKDKLVSIEPGPKMRPELPEELRESIRVALLEPGEIQVWRTILMSMHKVSGSYRFRDVFQITPASEGAPRPGVLIAEHPFVLECRFRSSAEFRIRNVRAIRVTDQLTLLLNFILPVQVTNPLQHPEHRWVLIPEVGGEWRTAYCQTGYLPGKFFNCVPHFSPIEGMPEIPRVAIGPYESRLGLTVDEPIDLPEDIDDVIGAYFNLAEGERRRFLWAAYWYAHARQVYRRSVSAAFVAMIQAIEVLATPVAPTTKCPTCGLEAGGGPTRAFVSFVESLIAPNGTLKHRLQDLYRLRSQLVHGNYVLQLDDDTLFGSLHPRTTREYDESDAAFTIARIIVMRWLRRAGAGQRDGSRS